MPRENAKILYKMAQISKNHLQFFGAERLPKNEVPANAMTGEGKPVQETIFDLAFLHQPDM